MVEGIGTPFVNLCKPIYIFKVVYELAKLHSLHCNSNNGSKNQHKAPSTGNYLNLPEVPPFSTIGTNCRANLSLVLSEDPQQHDLHLIAQISSCGWIKHASPESL